MKVLYDYQAFTLQKFGGISNTFVQLAKNLPKDVKYDFAVAESNNIHLQGSGLISVPYASQTDETFITCKQYWGKSKFYRLYSRIFPRYTSLGRNKKYSEEMLQQGDYDVFHPTFFSDYFLPYLDGKPFVLTVHDMIPERFADEFGKKDVQLLNKKLLVDASAHIIAVSEKTKEDLMELLHVPETKISVIYHAVPEIVHESSRKLVEGNYILYVGYRSGYKNFIPMMSQLIPILKEYNDLKIVCTGSQFNSAETRFFILHGIQDRIIHVSALDSEMYNLYAHAICFIYPSLYEGFGIPILEAWQARCPVLLNNKSCFPEIARDAAVYFNLDDQYSDLQRVMDRFLKMDDTQKKELIERQKKRLQEFSWKKSAGQLAEVYKMVL